MSDSSPTERSATSTLMVPALISTHQKQLDTREVGPKAVQRQQRIVVVALIIFDVLLALLVWEVAYMFQNLWGSGPLTGVAIAAVAPTVIVWVGLRALLGLYPGYGLGRVEELRRQTYAVLATAAITAIFAVVLQVGDLLSRLYLVVAFLGLLLLAPLLQHLARRLINSAGVWGKPVMVFGSGEVGDRVIKLLEEEWELGYEPVAVFEYQLIPAKDPFDTIAYEENLKTAASLARERGVDTVIFAMYARREQVAELVTWASVHFRHVMLIPNLGGITNSAVVARNLEGTFAVEIKHNLLSLWALRSKRAIDLISTIVGGTLVLPLILLLALLIYLESRGGPVFYKDWRMGRDGKLFLCLKFRTMVPNAEDILRQMLEENPELNGEYLKYHKLRDDPRVTRVGRFLRRTSLDELPQLWNVLKGEMSLVGPRPYLSRESKEVGTAQSEILRVPPGITGLWQVAGRNHTSFEERVHLDAYYVRDWSVWLDIVLLARTAKSVLLGRGAY